MSNTNDHARIRALLESGRITQAEADLLLAALDETEQKPYPATSESAPSQASSESPFSERELGVTESDLGLEDLDKLGEDLTDEKLGLTSPVSPPTPVPPVPPLYPSEPPPAPTPNTTPVTWLKLLGFCGDLSVRGEPGLSTPVVTGNATLERTPEGYLIRTPPGGEEGGKGWLSRLHRAAGDVEVRLPPDMGLELGIAAGDGEVRGVKTLRGNFTGGDFEVSGAEHVDLTVTAGDVTLKLNPQRGEQRVRATSGDVDIVLMAGSSVRVSGSATCGDLDVPPSFSRQGGFPGRRFEGVLGAGEARLDLRLTAGDIDIRAEGA